MNDNMLTALLQGVLALLLVGLCGSLLVLRQGWPALPAFASALLVGGLLWIALRQIAVDDGPQDRRS
jgi:hypothetical protein